VNWFTAILVMLLLATLVAYFSGIFPYPFGWLILIAVLFARSLRE